MKKHRRLRGWVGQIRSAGKSCALGAILLSWGLSSQAVPPPSGVAPVVVPSGGFAIDGDLTANTPTLNVGDWLPDANGNGGVLDLTGAPLNPATTFHFTDLYNSGADNTFSGGKWTDDPNTWQWVASKASSKTDINNVLMHITTDANGHSWIIIAGDRLSTSGDSYIDFEFLQNTLVVSNNGTFASAGPNGGRTVNDLLLTLMFTSGGSSADFAAFRWQASGSGYTYVDATASLPTNRVFVAANGGNIGVPYGAFGATTYGANAFAEAAIDLTALLGNFDPCLSIGVASIMVKTKVSQSGPSSISDFINPIQYTLRIGPSSYAGPNQTRCTQGASTDFSLHGQATQGLQPIASTAWSVVSGTATIDSTSSLSTTAHVSSPSATLRLTVIQSNGCTETSDLVLTVAPTPTCSIAGASSVTPSSTSQFFAPSGQSAYSWSVSGNGSISGPTNAQMVTVTAGTTCGANFTLSLNVTNGSCSSSCSTAVAVNDTLPPTINAPADFVLECPADTSTNHNGTATATDNAGPVTLTYSDTVTTGCGGSKIISRLWTATDRCGNAADAIQKITVQDTTPPLVQAPANVTIACGASLDPGLNSTLGTATATDGCSGASTPTYTDQTVAGNCAGNYTVKRTWSSIDGCGNVGTALQTITVRDTTAPTLSGVPANLTVQCNAVPAPATPTASDSCDPNPSVSLVENSTQDADAAKAAHYNYTLTRTWTATDACGNHSSQSQLITVHDTSAPVLAGQGQAQTIQCPATPSFTAPTASDNCDPNPQINFSDVTSPGACAGNYSVTRTWTAKDASGNVSAPVSQTITVQDITAPVLSGVPANATVECSAVPAPATPTASDSCDSNPIVSLVENSTQEADATKAAHYNYTLTRTWTATDACGNHTSQSQVLTVRDTTAPILSGQGSALTIQCPATPSFTAPTANDNCDPNPLISFTDSTTAGSCAGNYSVTRAWTAKDASGNLSTSVSQTITVQDITPPALSGVPANAIVECSAVPAPAAPTASDACDPNPSVSFVQNSTQDLDATQVAHYNYTLTRTWTATDACGNHSSQSQMITVHDTTAPVLNGQGPALTIQCPATPAFTAPTASDNCDPNPKISFSDSTTLGTCAGNYSITRTWTAKDVSGNVSLPVSQTITVQDITPPVLAGVPANATVECSAVPAPATPTASDSCDPNPSVSLLENSTQDSDATKVGHYNYTLTRTWTATDACGNHSSQSQVITVHDTTAPVLSGQGSALTIQCPATPSFTAPTASDNCDPNPQISFTDSTAPGSCAGNYSVTRTWTAKDVAGNVSLPVSQTITVQDITPPVLAGVPANTTVECSAVPAPATPTVSDSCDSNPSITYNQTSTQDPDATKLAHYNYTLTRTWTATDACGNHSSQSQVITVHDTTAPVLSGQGSALTINCPATPSFTAPTASDNCDPNPKITFTDTTSPGSCAGNYSVTRTWTAKDVAANVSLPVSQTITVQDITPPVLAGVPANTTVQCSAIPAPATPTASDSCDSNPSISYVQTSTQDPDATKLAHYNYTLTRTWTATDACGNHSSQSQVITVHDTTAPVLSGQGSALTIQCPATPSFTAPTASDNCDPNPQISFTDSTAPGSCAGNYSVTRTWTAKDVAGNVSLPVSQTITVQDITPPVVTAPANITIACTDSHDPSVNTVLGVATSVDGCSSASTPTYADQIVAGNCAGNYTIKRTWSSHDACGNVGTALQTITVRDTTPPTVTAPPSLVLECPADTSTNATGVAVAQDGCDSVTIAYSDVVSNICGSSRLIKRTWTAVDACGNSASALQTITLRDTTPPTITAPPSLVLECPASTTTNNTGVAVAQDSCGSVTVSYSDVVTNGCGNSKFITRTWTAADGCGNSASALQTITLRDTTPPSLRLPANVVQQCPGDTRTNVTGVPIVQDGCGSITLTFSDIVSNSCALTKTVWRTWTAVDQCGNVTNGVQTIAVIDTTAPTITCPNLSVQCVADVPAPYADLASFLAAGGTATDSCSPGLAFSLISDSGIVGSCPGKVTRVYRATDACGNFANVTQTITVDDTIPPIISGPTNAIVECGTSLDPANTGLATATDNCDPHVSVTYSDAVANSSSYSIKLYAADPNPSSGPYQPTYIKFGPGSLVPPAGGRAQDPLRNAVAFGPTAGTLDALTSMGSANLFLGQIVPYEAVIQVSGGPGTERGTIDFTAYWNTYTSSNNRFGYDTNYLVYAAFVDTGDVGMYDQNSNARVESFSSQVVNRGTIDEQIQGTFRVSGLDSGDQVVVEIWVVLDSSMPDHTSGNIAAGLVSAQKDSNPPQPITTGTQTTVIGNIGKLSPLPAPQQQPPLPPLPPPAPSTGSSYLISAINRTWTATDACGNSSTFVQQITVRDTTPPVLSVPPDLALECPADTSTNNTGTATAQDACGSSTLTYNDTVTNGCGGTRVVSRLWTAIDQFGTITNRVQIITVRDRTPPTITAPPNLTLECPANTSTNNTGVATAHDGCSGTTVTYSDSVNTPCGGTRVITRTWTAVDACGNVANAIQTITVQDTKPPSITAPANLVLPFTADISTNSTGVATTQDTCSAVTLSYHDAVTIEPDGTQVIARTWVAADACGNSASAVQTITLDSPAAPVLPNQTNVFLTDLTTLTVTNTATNPNLPANPMTYQLINPPAGATIDANGIITWTPTVTQSPSTNVIITVVSSTATTAAGSSPISATNSFVVIVSGPYDGINLNDPAQALADNDGDGLSNLLEYSVGSDPKNSADASTGLLVWITQDSGNHYLAMKFKRRVNAASLGLQYFAEVSADKQAWAGDSANVLPVSVTPLDSQFDWVTVRDVTPIAPTASRFVHLRVLSGTIETASPTWIGTATTVQGNGGTGFRMTMFSQRMVLPIAYAGTVSSLQNTALTDTNATWTTGQFASVTAPSYAEFDNGWMVDISGSTSVTKSLALAGNLTGVAAPGDAYRVRQHFTIASLFGTNNETGLKSGESAAQADTILLQMAQNQTTMTIFYYSNQFYHGWVRGDLSPADQQVIYPEQGLMVLRMVPGDRNVYACGPIKTGVAVAPIEPGFNLLGTLKSLSNVNLGALNLYTGNPATGLASGMTASGSDNLMVVKPDGTTTLYFYYNQPGLFSGWVDGALNPAGNVPIPAGSAFFIKRQSSAGQMDWTIPAE